MTKRERDLSRLSAELARWRNEAGLTQQELAVLVGSTLNYIQKVEGKGGASNTIRPSMDRLILLVTTLDHARLERGMSDDSDRIDTNYALSLAGYPPIATPVKWVSVLQKIAEIPTNKTHTREDVKRIAQEILIKLRGDHSLEGKYEADSEQQGNIPGSGSASEKGQTEETGKTQKHRPPHSSR